MQSKSRGGSMVTFTIEEIVHSNKSDKENLRLLKKTVRENEKEIENLQYKTRQRLQSSVVLPIEESTNLEVRSNKEKKETPKINQVDVSMQLELLSCCNNLEDLLVFMPLREDKDYYPIVHTMLLELQKQMISYELTIRKSKMFGEKIDTQAVFSLNKINQMQSLLSDYMEEQEEVDLIEETISHPTLLYTTTKAGKVCLLNDLKEINEESYPEFLTLFESIVSGNVKRPKIINTSTKKYKNSFYQIRLDHSRMTFHVLTSNCVVITGAFTKKVQKNRVLGDKFKSIDKNFADNKEFFLNNYTNPEFIKEQEQVTKTVYRVLRKER